MRGVLISIDAWDRTALARVTVRIGAGLNAATLGAEGYQWEPALLRRPRLSQQLLDEDLTGSLMVGQGEFILSANLLRNVNPAQLDWVGAPVRIYTGDGSRLSDLTREFVGRITGGVVDARTGQVPVQVEVDKAIVDVPLLVRTYGGGGGADGDPEIRGTFKPAGYGRPINVKPVLIDQVNDVYQADAYGNCILFAGVYENLASFGPALQDYPTYAALIAADIPEGRWASCNVEGMFRLGAPATGTITCDPVCGAGTPGEMMLRWLRNHAGVVEARLRVADFAALTAAVQAAVGAVPAVSYWTVDEGNVLDLMQRMCASCNAVPLFMLDGTITVTRIMDGSPAALTLDRQGGTPPVVDWASLDPSLPWWRLRMTAARTYNVHTPADIDYEDDIKDRGDYVPGETYRQGHVVRWTDNARYLFVNPVPTKDTPPPTAGYWELYEDAPDATQIRYPSGYTLADLEPAEKGATVGMTTAEEQAFALAQASIAVILSDNVVAAGQEKAELKRRFDQAKAAYDGAHGTSVGFIPLYGDVTYAARVNADAALSAVTDYLAAVRPAWDNQSVDTPVDGSQLTIRFANLWDKIAKLNQANDAFIRDRARQAQRDIDAIASDSVLSRGSEKAKAIQERDAQEDDYAALVARYIALGSPDDIRPAAQQAAGAIQARRDYLASLTPAWDNTAVDTPIVQSVWKQMWGNAYAAISTFRAAITGRKGDKGDKGDSAYAIINTNEAHTVAADKDGNVYDYGDARFTVTIFYGTVDVTSSFALESTDNPQGLGGVAAYPTYSVTSGFDANEATASVTYNFLGKANTPHANMRLSTVFSLSKSRDGAGGASAALIDLSASALTARYDTTGALVSGQAITFNARRQNTSARTLFTLRNSAGQAVTASYPPDVFASTYDTRVWSAVDADTITLTEFGIATVLRDHGGATGRITMVASIEGTALGDTVSLQKVQDGAKGEKGDRGESAPLVRTQWSITGYDGWHDNFMGGDIYQRQSNDNGATWGPAVRVVGESGGTGSDGTSPSFVFLRSPTVPGTPATGSGNPPPGWSDGPPGGTDFLWQTKATFRGATQLTPWSAPIRITGDKGDKGDNGVSPITLELSSSSVTIYGTYTGTTKPQQLPIYVQVRVLQGTSDVTDASAITVTPSVDAIGTSYANRNVSITKADAAGSITVAGSVGGVALPARKIQIVRQLDPAPPASVTSTSKIAQFGVYSSSYNDNQTSPPALLTVGSSGTIYMSAGGTYSIDRGDPRSTQLAGKLVYRVPGASAWNDMTGETFGTTASGDPQEYNPGSISINNASLSNLSPDTTYEFSLRMRISGSGTEAAFFGTVTVSQTSLA